MKKASLLLLAAALFAACGAPPANNTATNTNTAPVATGPTADTFLALDKAANEAYFKGDAKYFETFLSDKFGWSENGKHRSKADVLKYIAGLKCDMKEGWKLEDGKISKIDEDTYAFSYKGTFDGACTYEGKAEKQRSPVRAATIFVKNGDKWQAAWHGEMPLSDMANTTDTKKPDTNKPADAKKDDKADAAKPAETKKEEPKKEEGSKPIGATKTAPANATAGTAANTAPPAEVKADPNTDALVKAELAGWQAWRDKDAAKLDSLAAKNLTIVDPNGFWIGSRAEVLKSWDGTGCENIKNVDVKNGFAWALSPTVEILTYEASADGTCKGAKNGSFDGMSVYVKEGDAWKVAFSFMQPKGKI